MEKNDAQISGLTVGKIAPSLWKKNLKKKKSSSLFVQIRSTKRCAEIFFKMHGSQDI